MKKIKILLLSTLPILLSWTINVEPDFDEILKQADFYRGGQISGITWNLKVENIERNELRNELNLKVEASSLELQQFALITFLEPKKYSGQKMLLRGNNFWFVKRGMRRPVPISGRQRLTGSAANADIASANYYQDYNIINTSEDTINGISCWVLELEAKNNLVNYSKIKYWIDKKESKGLKAEYYGKTSQLIKSGFFQYDNTFEYNNKKYNFVSKIIILDAINKEDKTILYIDSPTFQSFSNSKFQKNNLLD